MSGSKPPPILDAIVDVVLAYKPKAKTEGAKKRKKKIKKLIKEAEKHSAEKKLSKLDH
jgi:hypothetical protein